MNKKEKYKILINEAVIFYEKGYSLTQISKILKIQRQTISIHFKKRNIEVINFQNIEKCDSSVFKIIDTEEKAYWLGFLYADGYVSNKNNVIELSLKLSDKNHLIKFKNFLKATLEVKTDSFRCRFSIGSKDLHANLVKLGCIPNKSLILKFPTEEQVPNDLIRHFIRGYFDGDGFIGKYSSTLTCGVVGTKDVLLNIQKYCGFNKFLSSQKDWKEECKEFRLHSKNAMKFLNILYYNCSIYLDRKYLLYNKYCRL
jgi:intein/homing endonuclease